VNLSTGRILIIVALIVGGLAVLANGFLDTDATVATPAGSVSPGTTASPSTSATSPPPPTATPEPQTEGVLIMALNGTDVAGAGAAAQDLLVTDGYRKVEDAADAPVSGVKKTTVYYRDDANAGQNKSDATYIADTYFEGAPVKKLDPSFDEVVPASVSVVVVVGEDYASTLTT